MECESLCKNGWVLWWWQSSAQTLPLLAFRPSPSFGVKLLTLVPFGRVRPRTLPKGELLITGALTRCRGCCIRRRIYNYCRGGTLWRR